MQNDTLWELQQISMTSLVRSVKMSSQRKRRVMRYTSFPLFSVCFVFAHDYPLLFFSSSKANLWKGILLFLLCLELKKTKRYAAVFVRFEHFSRRLSSRPFLLLQRRPTSQPRFRFHWPWWPLLMNIIKNASFTVCRRNTQRGWNRVKGAWLGNWLLIQTNNERYEITYLVNETLNSECGDAAKKCPSLRVEGWFEPLADRIVSQPNTTVFPSIEAIDPTTLSVSPCHVVEAMGIFRWRDLTFQWGYSSKQLKTRQSTADPIE